MGAKNSIHPKDTYSDKNAKSKAVSQPAATTTTTKASAAASSSITQESPSELPAGISAQSAPSKAKPNVILYEDLAPPHAQMFPSKTAGLPNRPSVSGSISVPVTPEVSVPSYDGIPKTDGEVGISTYGRSKTPFWTPFKPFFRRISRHVNTDGSDDVADDELTLSPDSSKSEVNVAFSDRKLEDVIPPLKETLFALLVFPKMGHQFMAFRNAIKHTKFKEFHANDRKSAFELCKDYSFDLILIDTRNSKMLNAKELCRKLRAKNPRTIIVAVRKRKWSLFTIQSQKESMQSYLSAGFSRDFVQNTKWVACYDALLCFEKDVKVMNDFGFLQSMFYAVENCQEAIEISNAFHEIQYINRAYERHLGYTNEDLVGKLWFECMTGDRNPSELAMKIRQHLDTSHDPWEGLNFIKKKSGEQISNSYRIFPQIEAGKVVHFIGIRKFPDPKSVEWPSGSNLSTLTTTEGHSQVGARRMSLSFRDRLQSITATSSRHSVFSNHNLLNDVSVLLSSVKAIQCPTQVYQIIDGTCELLRNFERAGQSTKSKFNEDDELINDFVHGLMTTPTSTNTEDETRGQRRVREAAYSTFSKSASLSAPGNVESPGRPSSPVSSASNMPSSAVEIHKLLDSIFDWNFNIIKLEELTYKRPLLYAGLKIFQSYEVYSFLNTDAVTFKNWLDIIEHNYNTQNPYHNSTHAADVLQAASCFCRHQKMMEIFDDMDVVATLIAAVIHDLDHPGRTNSFLINSGHKLAILYNDVSVLENHHIALAFRLTFKDNTVNIFQKFEKEDYRSLRHQVIDMVLATDMTNHFDHLNRFNDAIQTPIDSSFDNPDLKACPMEVSSVIKRMLIKCCDVSNPTRPLSACKVWAQRIAEEYCRQTDEEKSRGLPVVMPVFDRTKCNLPKTQLSFMKLFIMDMMESWNQLCPIDDLMKNLKTNYDYWQQEDPSLMEKVVRISITT